MEPDLLGKMWGGICDVLFFVVCGSTSGPLQQRAIEKASITTIEFNDRIIVIAQCSGRFRICSVKNHVNVHNT